MVQHYSLIVLGTDPAVLQLSITAQTNLPTAIITGLEQGGQLTKSTKIENWHGSSKKPPRPLTAIV